MITLISRYDSHPSMIAIKRNVSSGQKFIFKNVALLQIYHMLIKMDGKKATDLGEISRKFLKIGATHIAGPISQLINFSILECKFPDILKYAEVNALFKRIDELLEESYRPINVLTSNQIKSSLLPYFTADCFPYIIQHSQCSTPMFNSSTRRHVFTQSHMCMHMCMCTYAYIFMYI